MSTPHFDLTAIVQSTASDVSAKAAAITFRMWHALTDDLARRLLFTQFVSEGRVVTLLEAVAASAFHDHPHRRPRPLIPAEARAPRHACEQVEAALLSALSDSLGDRATGQVLGAWSQAFRNLAGQMAC